MPKTRPPVHIEASGSSWDAACDGGESWSHRIMRLSDGAFGASKADSAAAATVEAHPSAPGVAAEVGRAATAATVVAGHAATAAAEAVPAAADAVAEAGRAATAATASAGHAAAAATVAAGHAAAAADIIAAGHAAAAAAIAAAGHAAAAASVAAGHAAAATLAASHAAAAAVETGHAAAAAREADRGFVNLSQLDDMRDHINELQRSLQQSEQHRVAGEQLAAGLVQQVQEANAVGQPTNISVTKLQKQLDQLEKNEALYTHKAKEQKVADEDALKLTKQKDKVRRQQIAQGCSLLQPMFMKLLTPDSDPWAGRKEPTTLLDMMRFLHEMGFIKYEKCLSILQEEITDESTLRSRLSTELSTLHKKPVKGLDEFLLEELSGRNVIQHVLLK